MNTPPESSRRSPFSKTISQAVTIDHPQEKVSLQKRFADVDFAESFYSAFDILTETSVKYEALY
jgi:hypothetical protein